MPLCPACNCPAIPYRADGEKTVWVCFNCHQYFTVKTEWVSDSDSDTTEWVKEGGD